MVYKSKRFELETERVGKRRVWNGKVVLTPSWFEVGGNDRM